MLASFRRRVTQRLRGETNVSQLVAQGLQLGRDVYIGPHVYLDAGHPWLITLGDESVLTRGSVVLVHDGSTRIHTGCTRLAPVSIGKRVFVGTGAVILAGSTVGDDSVIGALTVVRGHVPAGSVVVGNPGQVVSDRETFAARHQAAIERGPVWPHHGWTAGRGITEERKRAQVDALSNGTSGYLSGARATLVRSERE
jgi:maltose O-acetyltransferase